MREKYSGGNTFLLPFPSFTESSQEAATPTVFSLEFVSQIVFNVLGTPQLSMASMDRLNNSSPRITHAAAIVTPPQPVVVH